MATAPAPKPQPQPVVVSWEPAWSLPWAREWLQGRAISEMTAELMGLGASIRKTKEGEEIQVIQYPYFDHRDQIVNVKHRLLNPKSFRQHENAAKHLYNLSSCIGAEAVVVVEGEQDVVA